jgi:hypothetical protein
MNRPLRGATIAVLCMAVLNGCQSIRPHSRPQTMSEREQDHVTAPPSTDGARERRGTMDRNAPPYTKYPHLGRNHFSRPVANPHGDH